MLCENGLSSFLLNIYKPRGVTSRWALNGIRLSLERKREQLNPGQVFPRISLGHAGTLDPDASGVLVVGVGRKATRTFNQLLHLPKTYEFTVRLGSSTDTDDTTGRIVARKPFDHVTRDAFEAALKHFTGTIMQVPPMVSAVKIDGKRCYQLQRQGLVVEREARERTIFSLECTAFKLPIAKVVCSCSSGTYMRALATDIAAHLGTVGHCGDIIRRAAGDFHIDEAIRPDKNDNFWYWPPNRLVENAIEPPPMIELPNEDDGNLDVSMYS